MQELSIRSRKRVHRAIKTVNRMQKVYMHPSSQISKAGHCEVHKHIKNNACTEFGVKLLIRKMKHGDHSLHKAQAQTHYKLNLSCRITQPAIK